MNIALRGPPLPRGLAKDLGLGLIFWLAFLLLLEPGNVVAAQQAGRALDVGREIVRIVGAAVLGTAVTPFTLWLVRVRPVRGAAPWRNAALHALACAVVAALLIAASCPLAAWLIGGPTSMADAIRSELSANWALLFYGLTTLTAAGHLMARRVPPAPRQSYPARLEVTTGRRTVWLDLAEVDWVEAQGNYVALHAAGVTHLLRSTLGGLEAQLDPQRFVRIHRRFIVAIDRVAELAWMEGGDAGVRLRGGMELRLSRTYRNRLRERL